MIEGWEMVKYAALIGLSLLVFSIPVGLAVVILKSCLFVKIKQRNNNSIN
jgi:hypothetical protein